MKVVWNTCDKELGDEIKSVNENYFKDSLENFQKSFPIREIHVKYLEKNCIVTSILYSYRYRNIDIGIVSTINHTIFKTNSSFKMK